MRRLRVGLIGAGKHGQRYVKHVRDDLPELTLHALSRQDATAGREQAAALGARFHHDWRALVADPEVDAVIAVVPPALHPDIATAVARERKPLLIEKPLATTGADAVRVARTLAAVPALVAHTLRWNTVVGAMRERLPALGALHALVLNQRFEPSRLAWLDDPAIAGGGIVLHTGVHSFDLVRHLTGRNVARVWCRTSRARTIRTEDNFLAQLELDGSPTLVAVGGSRSTAGRSGLIDAAGDAGQLVGDHALHHLYGVKALQRMPIALPDPAPTVREALRAFAALVLEGTPPRVSLEDGARAVQIADACRRSAAAGGEGVAVDLFPKTD
jgi:predicted dehydrogenase